MLRITDSASVHGAKEYFDTSLRQADYYAEGQEIVGVWHGHAAERLGLKGAVTREAFRSVIDNRHPETGAQLTPRMKADRRPGTDFTFNAPKSVSLLYALHRDERIVEGFRRAVAGTMEEIERDVKTRVRMKGGNEDRVTGNFAWAEFLHNTARPVGGIPDPHLHIHAYVPNLTFDEAEGRWKAIQLGDTKADGAYFEAAFLSRLAIEMRALGYGVERHGRFWDIAGIPRDLVERFSRRTAEIERAAAEQGITEAARKANVGPRTRERKAEELSLTELRDVWISRLGPRDRKALDLAAAAAETAPVPTLGTAAQDAVTYATDHAFERRSVVPERQMLASALHHAYGDSGPERLRQVLDRADLIRRTIDGRALVSSGKVLTEEQAMLTFAREGRLTCRPLAPARDGPNASCLNEGQRRAVAHVLASKDRVTMIRGGAGTGKTTLMREAVDGMMAGGTQVGVFAPTSAARDVLRKEGFADAETLQRLLIDTEMQKSVAGRVLWIDEAGLVSTPDMARLTQLAQEQHCRIVLSGDSRQHASVARGDALRLLETHAGIRAAEVTQIVRQAGDYREAVREVSTGHAREGFARFEAMGAVIEESGDARFAKLAEAYGREVRAGRSVLVVSPTHREKDAVTAAIRKGLAEDGKLGAVTHGVVALRNTGWTEAQRGDAAQYEGGEVIGFVQNHPGYRKGERVSVALDRDGVPCASGADGRWALPLDQPSRFKVYRPEVLELRSGDVIRITENGATLDGHRLSNGAVYHVGEFDAAGNVQLRENGWTIARDFGHLDYGYCSTSVSAQGRTVDTVLVAMGRESVPAMSQEQFYVTVSRGRHAMRLYTDDKEAVRDAIGTSMARGSATELLAQDLDRKAAPRTRQERLEAHQSEAVMRHVAICARERASELAQGHGLAEAGTVIISSDHRGVVSEHEAHTSR